MLIDYIDLAHSAAQTVLSSVWKRIYYFTGVISVDERGLVVVVNVPSKQENMKLFFLVVTNYCESSLILAYVLPWWLVPWYNPACSSSCAPTEAS